ncbi:MAG: Gfo/Idh/MocA family oxidoreductase, partial [bacterium]
MKDIATGRRTFLKTATAAVGAVIVKPGSVFGAPANSTPQLGIIGCGGRGKYVGRFFNELTDAKIVALSDPFEDRVEDAKGTFQEDNPRTYVGLESYKDLIQSDVDAVAITSPPYYHPAQVAKAVDAGKHVFMAKPVAVDAPGCLSIAESSRRAAVKKINFLVDFQTRSSPAFIETAKRVHQGDIGDPVCGQIFYHTGRLNPRNT